MKVLSAAYGTTVQDCGRFAYRHFGVGTAGALDTSALRLANLLVGNEETAAGLEVASGTLRLQIRDNRLLAWSGGDVQACVAGEAIGPLRVAQLAPNEQFELTVTHGRAWVAISGGVDVPIVLGSRSTDLRARFGGFAGRALRDGDELSLGSASELAQKITRQLRGRVAEWTAPQLQPHANKLRVIAGKEWRSFADIAGDFRIAMHSDRMALRLEGRAVDCETVELVSEPVVAGTIQVPRGGAPLVLLADCQTIGGYPKLAHVITVDLARAAQLQPLDAVSFEPTTLDVARALLRQREADIARFRVGLQMRVA